MLLKEEGLCSFFQWATTLCGYHVCLGIERERRQGIFFKKGPYFPQDIVLLHSWACTACMRPVLHSVPLGIVYAFYPKLVIVPLLALHHHLQHFFQKLYYWLAGKSGWHSYLRGSSGQLRSSARPVHAASETSIAISLPAWWVLMGWCNPSCVFKEYVMKGFGGSHLKGT